MINFYLVTNCNKIKEAFNDLFSIANVRSYSLSEKKIPSGFHWHLRTGDPLSYNLPTLSAMPNLVVLTIDQMRPISCSLHRKKAINSLLTFNFYRY